MFYDVNKTWEIKRLKYGGRKGDFNCVTAPLSYQVPTIPVGPPIASPRLPRGAPHGCPRDPHGLRGHLPRVRALCATCEVVPRATSVPAGPARHVSACR